MTSATAISLYRKHCEEIEMPCIDPHMRMIDRGTYWYFADGECRIGRSGLLIRKRDGLHTVIGSGLGHEREMIFWAYEQGLLTDKCDLIITGFTCDPDDVIDILTFTPPSQCGMKIPGRGRGKWYAALASLPTAIFSECNLYKYAPTLWQVLNEGSFSFEIRPTGQLRGK